MGDVCVIAVSVRQRLAVLDDGETFPLVTLLDDEGDATDDPDEAVVVVGQLADARWVTIDMREFIDAGLN